LVSFRGSSTFMRYQSFRAVLFEAALSWSRTRAKLCQLIANLYVNLLQLKLTNLSSRHTSPTFRAKKKDMNTDKLAINWQNFAQVRLRLKFVCIVRASVCNSQGYMKTQICIFWWRRWWILQYAIRTNVGYAYLPARDKIHELTQGVDVCKNTENFSNTMQKISPENSLPLR